jgi:hypothetical protein
VACEVLHIRIRSLTWIASTIVCVGWHTGREVHPALAFKCQPHGRAHCYSAPTVERRNEALGTRVAMLRPRLPLCSLVSSTVQQLLDQGWGTARFSLETQCCLFCFLGVGRSLCRSTALRHHVHLVAPMAETLERDCKMRHRAAHVCQWWMKRLAMA